MPDNLQDMKEALNLLCRAEKEFAEGKSIANICAQLDINEEELERLCDRYSMPPNMGESLRASRLCDAVFPIFYADHVDGALEHIGSGVVVEIGDELFALTVAHITDRAKDGVLFMPAADGITPISGGLSYIPVPNDGSRSNDKADIAYYHLANTRQSKLHPSFTPVSVSDLLLTDALETGDFFTFVGFPWRKTKHRQGVHETDLTTYTGHAFPPDLYERLGYSRSVHVLIRMRRTKTFSTRYDSLQTAPNPHGISGGQSSHGHGRFGNDYNLQT